MTNSVSAALIVVLLLTILLAAIRATRLSLQNLVLGLVGTIVGLLCGALVSIPLSNFPEPYNNVISLSITLGLAVIMTAIALAQRTNVLRLLPLLRLQASSSVEQADATATQSKANQIVVDTSVIIDGRIADIAQTGFVSGTLLVPRFVLAELQNIADSEDAMRRGRGRRGLEMLKTIRETSGLVVEVVDQDFEDIKEVDAKLVALAKSVGGAVLTTDFNLNRVAQIQGVQVLNINELANAIRPVVIPGELMTVHIVQTGKERGQGVGYLADGTMIVVDQGDKLIGHDVQTEVTRVFQTVAGKMIFAVPLKPAKGQSALASPAPAPAPHSLASAPKPVQPERQPRPPQTERQPRPPRGNRKPGHGRLRSQSQIEDSLIQATQQSPASDTPKTSDSHDLSL